MYSVFTAWAPVVVWGVGSAAAEVLPPADAPMFLDVVKGGQPSAVLVLPDAASEIERIAADKLIAWCETYAQAKLPLQRTSDLGPAAEGNYILLGTGENQPLIADMIKNGDGGPADLPFLSDEGFGLETVEKGKAQYLVIAGRKPKGVFHGAVYVRDFLLDILPPAEGVVIREVKLVRSPALAIRGPYLLTQYGKTVIYTLDHWKHIIDMMAEGGINQIHWWIAGMYPSERFPETFVATDTPMSVANVRELIRFAHVRGMTFIVGGGAWSWTGSSNLSKNHPEIAGKWGICPSHPESQRLMTEYALDWLETFPEADGIWVEPPDEGGPCKCPRCSERLDAFNSRQYGQSEMTWMKTFMKKAWQLNPEFKMVWLIELLDQEGKLPDFQPHIDDPLYFERMREIKDPRIEWMVVWEAFKLVGPRNERIPVPFFSRQALHWDKPYWPNLQNVFAHARIAAEQGYWGYSNAWEIGFASNDWYINEVPYPVDIIPEIITSVGFREACWEPGQTWQDFTDRVHRRFFSREVPRSVAEDMLYLRQYITSANHTMDHPSPMTFVEGKTLASEVDQVVNTEDEAQRKASAKKLSGLLEVLRKTRDEDLPRMAQIEARLDELEPGVSLKSKAGFALMRRAIADSREVYEKVVPQDELLKVALERLSKLN